MALQIYNPGSNGFGKFAEPQEEKWPKEQR